MFLTGKTALVTGSTSGIGLAIARALAAEGATVILNGFGDPGEIARLREELDAGYSDADLTRPEAIEAMLADAGPVDILVNNAGTQHVAPIDQFPPEKWDLILALNLSAAFHTIRLALPGDEGEGLGPDHQHRLRAQPGRQPEQVRLRRRQARHCRPHQDGGARGGDLRRHRQLHQPRLRLDQPGREPDPGHDEGARPDPRAGDRTTSCSPPSRPRSS